MGNKVKRPLSIESKDICVNFQISRKDRTFIVQKLTNFDRRQNPHFRERTEILDKGNDCCNDKTHTSIDVRQHSMLKDTSCGPTSRHSILLIS